MNSIKYIFLSFNEMAQIKTSCVSLDSFSVLMIFNYLFFNALNHATQCISAHDTISINQPLIGGNNLTSNGSNFVIGFFRPDRHSEKYYIGIWYNTNKVSKFTTVWEANREAPINDPKISELRISDTDNNLVLLNEFKSVVWSTAAEIPSNTSTVAVLLDNGNLQLRDEFNAYIIFWQSFDHPTNTLLPKGKLGLKKHKKETQKLTSWKNSVDPANGIFSFGPDLNENSEFYLRWNKSKIYWQSGSWSPVEHKFRNIPEMVNAYIYIYYFDYINTTEESYFTYTPIDTSLISRLILDVSGQIQQLSWVEISQQWTLFWTEPKQLCQIYALCGTNGICNDNITTICYCPEGFSKKNTHDWALGDYSGGCVRDRPLQLPSTSGETDDFRVMSNMRLPDNPQILAINSNEACKMVCTSSSSCTAYSFDDSECLIWYGDLINLQENYGGLDAATFYLRVVALSKKSRTKSKKRMVYWVVASIVVAAVLAVILFLIWRRNRRLVTSGRNVAGTLVRFRYFELQQATKSFSEKLGEGGFGQVYKGTLADSIAIAVKKLKWIQQGEKQFRAEVSTIGTLQHINLVRLLGFCAEANKRLLVYEYMPLSSLDTHLFQKSDKILDWNTRYAIAIGIARGLSYLHEECRICIIHCDIKPENILLDETFVPKIADFGLAKLLGRDFSRVLTTIRGTRGYLAPEWILGIPITAKADVYSYGMMLLEIISGRRNFEQFDELNPSLYFPTFAATRLVAGDVSSLLDSRLTGNPNLEQIERACKVACWCIQDDEKNRPTMSQVVHVLEGFQDMNMPPVPKLLKDLVES